MQEVQALCDRVVIINKGKIAANDHVTELKNIRRINKVLSVEFSAEIEISDIHLIKNIIEVNALGSGKYEIVTSMENDVRGEIFKLASEKGWTLLGMKQEERSLENVFMDLTGKNQQSE